MRKSFHLLSERRQCFYASRCSSREELENAEVQEEKSDSEYSNLAQNISKRLCVADLKNSDDSSSHETETDDSSFPDWSDDDDNSVNDINEEFDSCTLHLADNQAGQEHDEVTVDDRETLSSALALWKVRYSIGSQATSALLSILQKHRHTEDVQKDCRSLMKTPRNTSKLVVNVGEHKYIHF